MKPVIYICGPYRSAKGAYYILENILEARRVALEVWRAGGIALCPHLNTMLFDGAADDAIWLEGDLVLLSKCDAVLTFGDCEHSSGAQKEIAEALRLELPVFFDGALGITTSVERMQAWIQTSAASRRGRR